MEIKKSTKYLDSKILRRYLETRKLIDERADRVLAISYMLNLTKYCGDDTVPVSPHVLASISEMINFDICKIIECLDDFIYILDAEAVLNESKD